MNENNAPSSLELDYKALCFLIAAVECQMECWTKRTPDASEDEQADIANDFGYIGMILGQLKAERLRQIKKISGEGLKK